jgi:hypothetical protein
LQKKAVEVIHQAVRNQKQRKKPKKPKGSKNNNIHSWKRRSVKKFLLPKRVGIMLHQSQNQGWRRKSETILHIATSAINLFRHLITGDIAHVLINNSLTYQTLLEPR